MLTFSVAALAAASATYWALKWTAAAPPNSSAALVFPGSGAADPQVVARLLGGGQTGVAVAQAVPGDTAASRFRLTGVVADRAHGGYALISIDGKPARPYRVGAQVNDTLVLHSVAPRSAALAAGLDAPVSLTLELPKLSPPP
jgi:general secretion pathway protein C